MPLPANLLPVGPGVLPDSTEASFFVVKSEYERLGEFGPQEKYDDARFLEEAVREPDAIFSGLRRPNQDESLCYSVQITRDPDDSDGFSASAPRYGFVFLAFVRVAQMGYVIFDWEWRREDDETPGHPANWEKDFKERVWHRT